MDQQDQTDQQQVPKNQIDNLFLVSITHDEFFSSRPVISIMGNWHIQALYQTSYRLNYEIITRARLRKAKLFEKEKQGA